MCIYINISVYDLNESSDWSKNKLDSVYVVQIIKLTWRVMLEFF